MPPPPPDPPPKAKPRLCTVKTWLTELPSHLRPLVVYGLGASLENVVEAVLNEGSEDEVLALLGELSSEERIPLELKALITGALQIEAMVPGSLLQAGVTQQQLFNNSADLVSKAKNIEYERRDFYSQRLHNITVSVKGHEFPPPAHLVTPYDTAGLVNVDFYRALESGAVDQSIKTLILLESGRLSFSKYSEHIAASSRSNKLMRQVSEALEAEGIRDDQRRWLSFLFGEDPHDNLVNQMARLSLEPVLMTQLSSDIAALIAALRFTDLLTVKDTLKGIDGYQALIDLSDHALVEKVQNSVFRRRLEWMCRIRSLNLRLIASAMSYSQAPVSDISAGSAVSQLLVVIDPLLSKSDEARETFLSGVEKKKASLSRTCNSLEGETLNVVFYSGAVAPLTLQSQIGGGATGCVYRAKGSSNQLYAVKVTRTLNADPGGDEYAQATRQESNSEWAIASYLKMELTDEQQKDMILPVGQASITLGDGQTAQVLVTLLAEGGSLQQWIESQKSVSFMTLLELLNQGLGVVRILHDHNKKISHNDIRSQNLFVRLQHGQATLALGDFGYSLPEHKVMEKLRKEKGGTISPSDLHERYGIHFDISSLGEMFERLIGSYQDKLAVYHAESVMRFLLLARYMRANPTEIKTRRVMVELGEIYEMESDALAQLQKQESVMASGQYQYINIDQTPLAVLTPQLYTDTLYTDTCQRVCASCKGVPWEGFQHECGSTFCRICTGWLGLQAKGLKQPPSSSLKAGTSGCPFCEENDAMAPPYYDASFNRTLREKTRASCLECSAMTNEANIKDVIRHYDQKHATGDLIYLESLPDGVAHTDLLKEVYEHLHRGSDLTPRDDGHYSFKGIGTKLEGLAARRKLFMTVGDEKKVRRLQENYRALSEKVEVGSLVENVMNGWLKDKKGDRRWFMLFRGHDFSIVEYARHIGDSRKQRQNVWIRKAIDVSLKVLDRLDDLHKAKMSAGGFLHTGIRFMQSGHVVLHLREPVELGSSGVIASNQKQEMHLPLVILHLLLHLPDDEYLPHSKQPEWEELIKDIQGENTLAQVRDKNAALPDVKLDPVIGLRTLIANLVYRSRVDDHTFTSNELRNILTFVSELFTNEDPFVVHSGEGLNRKDHHLYHVRSRAVALAYEPLFKEASWHCNGFCDRSFKLFAPEQDDYTCRECFLMSGGFDICPACYQQLLNPEPARPQTAPVSPPSSYSSDPFSSFSTNDSLGSLYPTMNSYSGGSRSGAGQYSRQFSPPSIESLGERVSNYDVHVHRLFKVTKKDFLSTGRSQAWQCKGTRVCGGYLQNCGTVIQSLYNFSSIYHCPDCEEGVCENCFGVLQQYHTARNNNDFSRRGKFNY